MARGCNSWCVCVGEHCQHQERTRFSQNLAFFLKDLFSDPQEKGVERGVGSCPKSKASESQSDDATRPPAQIISEPSPKKHSGRLVNITACISHICLTTILQGKNSFWDYSAQLKSRMQSSHPARSPELQDPPQLPGDAGEGKP